MPPKKVKPDLESKGGEGAKEHDGNCKVEDDQEELCLLSVTLEVSPGRQQAKSVQHAIAQLIVAQFS